MIEVSFLLQTPCFFEYFFVNGVFWCILHDSFKVQGIDMVGGNGIPVPQTPAPLRPTFPLDARSGRLWRLTCQASQHKFLATSMTE